MVNRNIDYDLAIETIRRSIDDIHVRLNQFNVEHEELRKKPDVPSEFEAFKDFVSNKILDLNMSKDASLHSMKGFQEKLSKVFLEIEKICSGRKEDKDKLAILTESLDVRKQGDSLRIKDQELAFSKGLSGVREEIKKAIEALKAEILVSPASILETNQAIIKKTEEAKMDAANAMLKLANFDTQLMFFQRKLENLEIRIKKFELNQQMA
jgi:hypothetical protein